MYNVSNANEIFILSVITKKNLIILSENHIQCIINQFIIFIIKKLKKLHELN